MNIFIMRYNANLFTACVKISNIVRNCQEKVLHTIVSYFRTVPYRCCFTKFFIAS